MEPVLNQTLGFDEVRWATLRKTSYDSGGAFAGPPRKEKLLPGARLYRLVRLTTGSYFDSPWWMPAATFRQLHADANQASKGSGRLLRNYVAQYLALPSGAAQLCVVEIELTRAVFAWTGEAKPLFGRPGGMSQVFLPNLAERGHPRSSLHAKLVHTWWLKL